MEIPVLIEPVAGDGYRARGGEPFALTGEGATPEEALQHLRERIRHRLTPGARVVSLQVSPPEPPWAPFAGALRGDPMLQDWKQAMAEYRRKMDEDPDVP
jgi:hypothetical protein